MNLKHFHVVITIAAASLLYCSPTSAFQQYCKNTASYRKPEENSNLLANSLQNELGKLKDENKAKYLSRLQTAQAAIETAKLRLADFISNRGLITLDKTKNPRNIDFAAEQRAAATFANSQFTVEEIRVIHTPSHPILFHKGRKHQQLVDQWLQFRQNYISSRSPEEQRCIKYADLEMERQCIQLHSDITYALRTRLAILIQRDLDLYRKTNALLDQENGRLSKQTCTKARKKQFALLLKCRNDSTLEYKRHLDFYFCADDQIAARQEHIVLQSFQCAILQTDLIR